VKARCCSDVAPGFCFAVMRVNSFWLVRVRFVSAVWRRMLLCGVWFCLVLSGMVGFSVVRIIFICCGAGCVGYGWF